MASNAAAPFWRAAGMTYITYSNLCANLVRNCLKEPYKTEALTREKVHYSISKWVDGKPQKPSKQSASSLFCFCDIKLRYFGLLNTDLIAFTLFVSFSFQIRLLGMDVYLV
uniref:ATP synthase subunit epsilon, mitochondrial n=1 Tax=Nicotiana tabacum TaxID=4097 RepID=A0A1S3Y646_TOBAC|nr:PREDICTED: ATP synthase subunit epsilon, mitochondrial-like [Nicotiana tabacum]